MASIMTDVNAILTGILSGATSVLSTVTAEGNELIMFVILFGFAFSAVKIVRKLMGL